MIDTTWNRRTWALAGPVIITNISIPLLGAVDTAVVGHLPEPQSLGAIAVGALIFNVLYHGCNFLRMGTTGLTAQAYGAHDGEQLRNWFFRSVLVAASIGLIISVLQSPILQLSLYSIGASQEVSSISEDYFNIRIWGAPFALSNIAVVGWFIGTQNVRAALISQIFMNGLNIVLDLWFVIGLGWGIEGVAIATLASEISAVILAFFLARKIMNKMPGTFKLSRLLDLSNLRRMFSINSNIFVRSLALQFALLTLTATGARIDDITLAANVVLFNFFLFTSYALDGFANAAEALVGQAVGQKNRLECREAVLATGKWAIVFALIFSIIFWFGGNTLINLLTNIVEIREAAREYVQWLVLLPVIAVWSFQLDGVYIGATWSREMRNGMLLSLLIFLVLLFLLVPIFANHGLWAAFTIFMGVRGATLMIWYPNLELSIAKKTEREF